MGGPAFAVTINAPHFNKHSLRDFKCTDFEMEGWFSNCVPGAANSLGAISGCDFRNAVISGTGHTVIFRNHATTINAPKPLSTEKCKTLDIFGAGSSVGDKMHSTTGGIDPVVEKRRRLEKERRQRKKAEAVDRRVVYLSKWMHPLDEACEALDKISWCDRQLGGVKAIALVSMLSVAGVQASGIAVLVDTNQIKLLPANVKVEWPTNLYTAHTMTFITTNWLPVGPPVPVTVDGVPMRRQFESATLLTNVSHLIHYGGAEHVFPVSQVLGPVIGTRHYDFPEKMNEPTRAVLPLRLAR